jgi:hypothetical protein
VSEPRFPVPEDVAAEARRGIWDRRVRGEGGSAVALSVARRLAAREELTLRQLRHVYSFFCRADEATSPVALRLWGGDPGREWAERELAALAAREGRTLALAAWRGRVGARAD